MPDHDALLLAAADALAAWLHRDQIDKQGEPYIAHPRRVAAALLAADWPAEVVAAALLHDTLEDCEVFLDSLTDLLGEEVSDLVATVTHDKEEETYAEYIERIAKTGSPESRALKLADLRDNLDPGRGIVPGTEPLRERYLKAVERLEAVE